MIFDAYKRKELMEIVEKNRADILAYGYFTTDDHRCAELIANSTYNYHQKPPTMYSIIEAAANQRSNNEPFLSTAATTNSC